MILPKESQEFAKVVFYSVNPAKIKNIYPGS